MDRKSEVGGVDESRGALLKDALQRIRELRARVVELESGASEPIAVVGMACRFPGGVNGPEDLWGLLADGRDAITEVPAERWPVGRYYDADPDAPGKMATRFGGFVEGIDRFDAAFFGISPVEAVSIDPQQRLLLEVCWEALEHAGVAADRLMESATGVFVGMGSHDYGLLRARHDRDVDIDTYLALGSVHSVAAGRVSYTLGTQGPAMVVDTACSSSLVAVHLAVRSLRQGETDLALAGGVAALLAPEYFVNFSRARMLAADGRCKVFDAAADGYVRGEGCGVLVLERLSDSLRKGRRIAAVIRGSAVNQDGRSSGLTVPNGPAQEAVIRAALQDAGLPATAVGYVEAHGTGTSLGDPIEVSALGAALCDGRAPDRPLRIGSIKANLGHLEASAGVAGLIKAVLCLERGLLPRQLHLHTPSPFIDWARWPIEVVTSPFPWPRVETPRVVGVSSFGFSGTNAHVVIEEAPTPPTRGPQRSPVAAPVSARSPEALAVQADQLSRHLVAHPDVRLGDAAHTLATGRVHQRHRAAIVAPSREALVESLSALASGRPDGLTRLGVVEPGAPPEVALLFTGQGAQYPGMGRGLYESEPVFRREIDRCGEILAPHLAVPLIELLYGAAGEHLYETRYAQPAVVAFEWALAALWREWGVRPGAVLGHSLGEYAAVCVAGALRLEDALPLVAARGRLMDSLAPGAMAAVLGPVEAVESALSGWPDVAIASLNAPESLVVSGERVQVEGLCRELGARGMTCKPIRVAQAAHSRLVEPMLDALEEAARRAPAREADCEVVSNITAEPVRAGELTPAYWRQHARRTVRFAAGLTGLYKRGFRVFLEVGPRPTLTGFAAQVLPQPDVCAVGSLRPGEDDRAQLIDGLASLHCRGVGVRWEALDAGWDHRVAVLPTYPFERERYWFTSTWPPMQGRTEHGDRWESCVRRTRQQSRQAPFDLAPASFGAKWAALGRVTLAYQVAALRSLGTLGRLEEVVTGESLCRSAGIAPTYARLLGRWLDHLAEAGLVERTSAGWRVVSALPFMPIGPLVDEAARVLSDYPEMWAYVERCGPRLADVLTGRESPLDTLFPGGSFELADGLYHRSAPSRYLNAMVAAALEQAGRDATPDEPLQVLEVGAGTGGTTSAVLPSLDAARTRWCFTDVSDLFLDRARERLAAYPFVDYARLDIEHDPVEQGFDEGRFDAVVAANVLHATRDLGATMARVARLLVPGGLLVLSETTAHPRVFDITTGLIEGWQAFDDALRHEHPLLTADTWVRLVTQHGFRAAVAFPEADSPAMALGNHVVIAVREGERVEGAAVGRGVPSLLSPQNTRLDGQAPAAPIAGIGDVPSAAELARALPDERRAMLSEVTRRLVMRILRLDERRQPNLRDRLIDLGLDSLMAVQLRNQLATVLALEARLPATLVFDHPSCAAIGEYLAGVVGGPSAPPHDTAAAAGGERAAAGARSAAPDDIDGLTEEEAEAALLRRLEAIEGKRS